MRLRRLTELAGELVETNLAFLSDGTKRARIRGAVRANAADRRAAQLVEDDRAAAPARALPYAGLSAGSLALAGVRLSAAEAPHLNVLIGEVHPAKVFAGAHTALSAAGDLATALGLRLRVLMLDPTTPGNSAAKAEAFLADSLGLAGAVVVPREALRERPYGRHDLWLATHSKTAHSLQVACDAEVVDRTRALYLIQDYEPGFSAWSTESVLAQATYHAGFLPIVNSAPLRSYLHQAEGIEVPDELVFAPRFELDRLERAAAARVRTPGVRVLYYGRRSKHRNLFALGVSALRTAVLELGADADAVEFVSAGEKHGDLGLGGRSRLVSRGRIDWADYFDFLATVDVALSLQQSPHPSHPPFDAAISGALTVTNEFSGVRAGLHPRIAAVAATPGALGEALVSAIRESAGAEPRPFLPVGPGVLGGDWDDVLETVARRLGPAVQEA